MNKLSRVLALAVLAIVLIGAGALWLGRSRGQNALAKYKAELRAKGEKLSAEELGYPRPPEPKQSLDRLLAAANKVGAMRFQPSSLEFMSFVGPSRVQVVWAAPQAVPSTWAGVSNNFAAREEFTAQFTAQFTKGADITTELRQAVRTPPRYLYNDPTNFFNAPKSPFIGIRYAAQWLAADAMVALQARRLDEARQDIHALTQLTQFHREDHTLVSQMIRVAVAGLGLSVTWQALQADGWNEEMLGRLQKDWGSVELADSFEAGMLGERAFGDAAFANMQAASSRERMKYARLSTVAGPVQLNSPGDYFDAYVVMPFWAANADADEMLFLQHHQRTLDSIRKLRSGVPWLEVKTELNLHQAELDKAFSSPLARVRYLFSSIAIPNSVKGAGVCVRNETQRRMTVTVIALERYKLQSGSYPPNLEALVPRFISAIPVDPMSAKSLRYRFNPQRTFTLYSVGEDGRDDGGDATSSSVTNKFDFWSGQDAVWPVAAGTN